MSTPKLNLFSFSGNIRTLHITWVAFFITFMVWFNHAPLLVSIKETFDLTDQQIKALLIINVALTIPARIVIGMLVDKYGPRITFSLLLFVSSLICFFFAFADDYETLLASRFALGFVGAGFVIGIRMIAEWFPPKQVGVSVGIYGGWGNFGSAASALLLPTVALMYGGENGWRFAIAMTATLALVYSVIFYASARNTPKASIYFRPEKTGAMEITSKGDFFFYLFMNIPMYAALWVLTWKLGPANLSILDATVANGIYASLVIIYIYQTYQVWRINKHVFVAPVAEIHRYKFKQVAILNVAYFVTFGSELAVVSMLPLFFLETFELSIVQAGLLASAFAFMNLVARPGGGYISDKFGRKKTLSILLIGLMIGYFAMSNISSGWPIILAVLVTMMCSFFVQAGEGAVFAIVPLVKRRMTGQIAGMTGAYGNVGAVTFLTVFSFVDAATFFLVIAGAAVLCLIAVQFLDEPNEQTAEVMPDGTVKMIDVS